VATKVGINGFGRIGRNFYRAYLKRRPDFQIVAVNDLADPEVLAHVLKYDSTHGVLDADISASEGSISVNGESFEVLSEREPAQLPWGELGVDIVVESTGLFTAREGAQKHLEAGAKKVIISAPATDPDVTIVLGVNDDTYDPGEHSIVSNASCTTNCVAPMAKILLDEFGIDSGFMTTVHAYTTEQQLQDQIATTRKGKVDLRRIRAAPQNIVPATTGAAKATALVIPELKGKIDGIAIRVPTPDVSLTDLAVVVEKPVTVEQINDAFRTAANGPMKGIIEYTEEELVSSDFIGNPASCILDAKSTNVVDGTLLKVSGWYDNEWGYSSRCVDLLRFVGARLGD
jgi:glyceraldehyde 3-phosphate dehydrogenase